MVYPRLRCIPTPFRCICPLWCIVATFIFLSTMKKPLIALAALGVVLLIMVGGTYNSLVGSRGSVDAAWAQVETQYQRRADLIPNLVATVKGAANFEQSTLTAVTAARTQWQSAGSRDEKLAAAGQFDSALSRLIVSVEAYPTLQATPAYRDLMTQLEGTENRVSVARMDYNNAVTRYNVQVQQLPTMIVARLLGFTPEKTFQSAPGAENAPTVNFDMDQPAAAASSAALE